MTPAAIVKEGQIDSSPAYLSRTVPLIAAVPLAISEDLATSLPGFEAYLAVSSVRSTYRRDFRC
jgi:hypothetical protein